MLGVFPGKSIVSDTKDKRQSGQISIEGRSASRASAGNRGAMAWRARNRRVREIGPEALQYVDGVRSASRWGRVIENYEDSEGDVRQAWSDGDQEGYGGDMIVDRITPLTRKPSGRGKGRSSMGEGPVSVD